MVSKLLYSFLLLSLILAPNFAQAATLNKDSIIEQSEVAYNGITASHIEQYLHTKGSQLAGYTVPENFEVYFPIGKGQWDKISVPQQWQSNLELEVYHGKTISQLVYEWSTTNRSDRSPSSPGQINPLIILATMDKESGGITGAYRTNLVSEHPITLSWLMGYGFNGTMAGCVSDGNCDIDYNRQRAQWYGGPGQQIAESVSAFKSWTTNPTPLNSCTGQWKDMKVQGECLNLKNTISLALYRYTPTFSGNQLFLNLYTTLKETFPMPSQAPTTESLNDVNNYNLDGYTDSVDLVGHKSPYSKAFIGSTMIADMNELNWSTKLKPNVGENIYYIDYRRSDDTLINRKTIRIVRHKIGDINGDTKVDILDLSLLGNFWGHTDPSNSLTNLNPESDNEVNIQDLSLLASNWEK